MKNEISIRCSPIRLWACGGGEINQAWHWWNSISKTVLWRHHIQIPGRIEWAALGSPSPPSGHLCCMLPFRIFASLHWGMPATPPPLVFVLASVVPRHDVIVFAYREGAVIGKRANLRACYLLRGQLNVSFRQCMCPGPRRGPPYSSDRSQCEVFIIHLRDNIEHETVLTSWSRAFVYICYMIIDWLGLLWSARFHFARGSTKCHCHCVSRKFQERCQVLKRNDL